MIHSKKKIRYTAATLMLGVLPGRVLHLAEHASSMLQLNQPAADVNAEPATAQASPPAGQH